MSHDYPVNLALSANHPKSILLYLENHTVESGLYLLDVDLQADINGIELAAKIREKDLSATIIFITSKSELMDLVFRHKIEALDYITKDSPSEEVEQRTLDCIALSYKRFLHGKHTPTKYFTIKNKAQTENIPYDAILFFETNPIPTTKHRIILYTETEKYEFRGFLKEIAMLDTDFYHCHQSIVVNVHKIKSIDTNAREATMINSDLIPLSVRKIKGLLELWNAKKYKDN